MFKLDKPLWYKPQMITRTHVYHDANLVWSFCSDQSTQSLLTALRCGAIITYH